MRKFCLAFLATARLNGAVVRTYAEVVEFISSGKYVTGVRVKDYRTGKAETVGADLVVNAAGPWAGVIAAMAGVSVPVSPTAGVMVTLDDRLNNMVLNRLNKPSDGDIVVPQRATSIIGTTSWPVEDPDLIPIPPEHVARMIAQGERLLPDVRMIPVRENGCRAPADCEEWCGCARGEPHRGLFARPVIRPLALAYFTPVLDSRLLLLHLLRPHNEHRLPRGIQDALRHATHYPAFPPATAVR